MFHIGDRQPGPDHSRYIVCPEACGIDDDFALKNFFTGSEPPMT
jgi:hypothetical protein